MIKFIIDRLKFIIDRSCVGRFGTDKCDAPGWIFGSREVTGRPVTELAGPGGAAVSAAGDHDQRRREPCPAHQLSAHIRFLLGWTTERKYSISLSAPRLLGLGHSADGARARP